MDMFEKRWVRKVLESGRRYETEFDEAYWAYLQTEFPDKRGYHERPLVGGIEAVISQLLDGVSVRFPDTMPTITKPYEDWVEEYRDQYTSERFDGKEHDAAFDGFLKQIQMLTGIVKGDKSFHDLRGCSLYKRIEAYFIDAIIPNRLKETGLFFVDYLYRERARD